MHLCRDFQMQTVQADESDSVVLVAGFGRVGFRRGNHSDTGARVTLFSSLWFRALVPARRENQSAASVVRAAVAADQECP